MYIQARCEKRCEDLLFDICISYSQMAYLEFCIIMIYLQRMLRIWLTHRGRRWCRVFFLAYSLYFLLIRTIPWGYSDDLYMKWLWRFYARLNICVYTLDGERPCSSSESIQTYARSCAIVYGTRLWRGRAAINTIAGR